MDQLPANNKEQEAVIYSQGQKMQANICLPQTGAPGVVISHGLESSKDGDKWLVLSPRLCDTGMACLRFSYRGCGENGSLSEGNFEDTTLSSRIHDLKSAFDFIEQKGVDNQRLGVVGSSFGGMVAVGAQDKRIKAMVIMATPYRIPALARDYMELGSGRRLSPKFFDDMAQYNMGRAIKTYHCPLLIIHGSEDEIVPLPDAHRLYRHANEPKRLEIIEGANHTFSQPQHLEHVINLTLEWFHKYL